MFIKISQMLVVLKVQKTCALVTYAVLASKDSTFPGRRSTFPPSIMDTLVFGTKQTSYATVHTFQSTPIVQHSRSGPSKPPANIKGSFRSFGTNRKPWLVFMVFSFHFETNRKPLVSPRLVFEIKA
jgi:hypothetical protein